MPFSNCCMPLSGPCEVEFAGKVVDWIADRLRTELNGGVEPNLEKLILAGHSRGGNTAFAVALGCAKTKLGYSALIGIDPVAGKCKTCYSSGPHILTYVPQSFNLPMPVAVIGTGLGGCCAPDGVNHEEFYKECKPPRAHFVVKEYGHMDMLDDETPCIIEMISKYVCKTGEGPREFMRSTVGGLVVAFLRAHLESQREALHAICNPRPATLDIAEYEPAPLPAAQPF